MTVETFDEVRVKSIPEILADALLDAQDCGVEFGDELKHIRTPAGIARFVLANLKDINPTRKDYWYSNFVIVGIL